MVVFSTINISEDDIFYHSLFEADFMFLLDAKLTSVVERMSKPRNSNWYAMRESVAKYATMIPKLADVAIVLVLNVKLITPVNMLANKNNGMAF